MAGWTLAGTGHTYARHRGLSMVARATVISRDLMVSADVEGSRASVAAVVTWGAREGYVYRRNDGRIVLTGKGTVLLTFWDSRTRAHQFRTGRLA